MLGGTAHRCKRSFLINDLSKELSRVLVLRGVGVCVCLDGSRVHKLCVGYIFEASLPVLHQLINSGRRHVQTSPWYRYVSFHLLLPWLACFNTVIHKVYSLLTRMYTNRIEAMQQLC